MCPLEGWSSCFPELIADLPNHAVVGVGVKHEVMSVDVRSVCGLYVASIWGLQQGKGLGSIGFMLCAATSMLIQKAAFKSEN